MKTPPFLLGAAVLFWGWQSDFFAWSALMAILLESPRFVKARWEVSDAEIIRIWNFCSLLGLAAAVLAFTNNNGPANFGKFFEGPTLQSSQMAGDTTSLSAVTLIRWSPFVFFLFAAAQVFSGRAGFPLETISPILRYRRKQLLKNRRLPPRDHTFNACWPYFILCLFAASAHAATPDHYFFYGICVLLGWALWTQRQPGIGWLAWLGALGLVMVLSVGGQYGFLKLSRLASWADNYNASWLSRWSRGHTNPKESQTALGRIGALEMSSQIVLRVTPVGGANVPTYLREATYRAYASDHLNQTAVWYAEGGRNDFTTVPESPQNSGHWILQPSPTNQALVNISCYLDGYNPHDGNPTGLLPLPLDCDYLDQFFAYAAQDNNVGSVLAEGPGLVSFNASFGSNHSMDAGPDTNSGSGFNEDLTVPERERPALDAVLARLPLAGLNDAQKAVAVSRYFAANYTYSLWQDLPKHSPTNETALANFLLNTHRGHCEFFATATVLLLRELHIPARYAVGYVVHEPAGKHYVVRLRDAHAWCIVWSAREKTWQILDTTPASWVAEQEKRASPWQAVSDFFSSLRFEFAKFRSGQSHLRPYILWALIPTLGYLLYQIIFRRRRKTGAGPKKGRDLRNWPGMDSELYLLEKILARRGLYRQPGEPISHWLRQVAADPAMARLREPLRGLSRLHYRHRFDPEGLTPADRAELSRQAQACLAILAKT